MKLVVGSSSAQDFVSPRSGFKALTLLGPNFLPLHFCKIFWEILKISRIVKGTRPRWPIGKSRSGFDEIFILISMLY